MNAMFSNNFADNLVIIFILTTNMNKNRNCPYIYDMSIQKSFDTKAVWSSEPRSKNLNSMNKAAAINKALCSLVDP